MVHIPQALQRAQGELAVLSPFLKLSIWGVAAVPGSRSSEGKDAHPWVVLLG